MATTDTERYVRLNLLTAEGGTLICKEILLREVSRTPGSPGLSTLLHKHKNEIKKNHGNKDISGKHFYILKHTMDDETYLKEWDVQLLVKMILFLFDSTVSDKEKSHLNSILTIRNFICHKSQPRVDDHTFVQYWTKLIACMSHLSNGIEAATSQRISQLIDDLSCGPLDLQSSISKLEQLCKSDTQVLDALSRMDDKIENLVAKVKQLEETLGQDQRKIDIPRLKCQVRIICQNEGISNLVEDILMKVIDAAVKGQNVDQTDDNAVFSAVKSFLEDLDRMGADEVSAERGSIMLFICCRNLQGLFSLLTMFRNSIRLAGIEKAVKEVFKEDARVEFVLVEDSVALITEWIDEQMHHWGLRHPSDYTSHSSTMTLGIQCHSLESVSQVADYFEDGRAADRLYQLSKALSARVNDTVRIDATLKTDEFASALSLRMATGGKLSQSVLYASGDFIDRHCSICLKDNKAVESTKYCVDCDSDMCKSCTQWHETFPASSGHQVVDVSMATSSGGQKSPPLPTERCEEHHGKLLDTYCPTHDQLCCASCVSCHHGPCKNLQYIPKISQGVKKSKECKRVARSLEDVTKQLKKVKSGRLDVLQELHMEETESQKCLQGLRKRLLQHIDDLTKAESDKIKSRYRKVRDVVERDIKDVEVQLDATETCRKKLNVFQGDNESQLFVYIKQGEKNVKNGRSLTDTLKGSKQISIPKYIINNSIEKYLCDAKSLGELREAVKLTFEAEYNMKTAGDRNVCDITGLCVLLDGSVILADCFFNRCLKQLDHSYRVTRSLDMPTGPYDVCYTNSNNEVAVTLFSEGKVQFVRVGAAMEKTRSFRVDGTCRGICCSQGELFVCCGGLLEDHKVCVFTLLGQAVRTIQYNQVGKPLFANIWYITVSSNGSKLHVTAGDKGVITLDRTGNLLSTYTESELDAVGICTLDDDDLLVTDYSNNTVLHVSSDGKKLGVVLGKQDGIVSPWAVCYDSVNNKVILSTTRSETIKVYNLQ